MSKHLAMFLAFSLLITSGFCQSRYSFGKLTTEQGLSNNTVNYIMQDRKGRMWFGTYDGLNCYDGSSVSVYRPNKNSFTDNQIMSVHEDKKGNIWISQPNGMVSKLDENGNFTGYRLFPPNIPIDSLRNGKKGESVILTGPRGGFMLNEEKGAFVYSQKLKTSGVIPGKVVAFQKSNPQLTIQRYWPINGNAWYIATLKDGLIKLEWKDRKQPESEIIRQVNDNPFSITGDEAYSLCTDKSGITWIGTKDGGVSKLLPQAAYLKTLVHSNNNFNTLPQGTIRAISEDSGGQLWIGSYTHGVAIYNPQNGRFGFICHSDDCTKAAWDRIRCIYQTSDKRMWVGSYGGLYSVEPTTGKRTYYQAGKSGEALSQGRIYSLAEDRSGFLWIGSWGGIDKLNLKTGKISHVLSLSLTDMHVRKIMFDTKGHLWIGTEFGGVEIFDPSTQKVVALNSMQPGNTLSNNSIFSFFEAKNGFIWIGTSEGINIYNPQSGKLSHLRPQIGLPEGIILGILEDNQENIWLSTPKGVARIDHKTQFVRCYDKNDGWVNSEFSEGACFRNKNGELFFGGISGITYFHPEQLTGNTVAPEVSLSFLNEQFRKLHVGHETALSLSYRQRNLHLRIEAFHYLNPGKNRITYRILPGDTTWHISEGSRKDIQTGSLKSGSYRIQYMAANADGIWSPVTMLRIRIRPPFFMSTWFIVSFIITASLLTLALIRVRLSQEKRRNRKLQQLVEKRTCELENQRRLLEVKTNELELFNSKITKQKDQILAQHEHLLELHQKLKESDEFKMNFFTNMSHEIRTPLTLISGPVENLLLEGNLDNEQMEQLFLVRNQTNILLNLVNQLLDHRQLESGSVILNNEPGEIVSFCREICHLFSFEANSKNIQLYFETGEESLLSLFDAEKIRKIISNLISNALKFTPSGGSIRVSLSLDQNTPNLVINVEDNGIGIPSDRIRYIFDRFYQVGKSVNPYTPGTGIGLSLALELARIHRGSITVESEEGKGSRFTFTIPYEPVSDHLNIPGNDNVTPVQQSVTAEAVRKDNVCAKDNSRVLIIDDHPEMLSYLQSILRHKFAVITVSRPKEAMKILKHEKIEIILCDWLMPDMDGIEFCRKVKENKQYMHIPFIMITALNGNNNHIKALISGADDFITKPFSPQLLVTKISNLLQRENILKESFTVQEILTPENKKEVTEDDKLLAKLIRVIEEKLGDSGFDPDMLGESLGLSKMQLYRKVKQLTGMAPNELIQSTRLKRARQILQDTRLTISEVGYKVGFNDPKYFSKCFYRLFGIHPSQFQADKEQKNEVEY